MPLCSHIEFYGVEIDLEPLLQKHGYLITKEEYDAADDKDKVVGKYIDKLRSLGKVFDPYHQKSSGKYHFAEFISVGSGTFMDLDLYVYGFEPKTEPKFTAVIGMKIEKHGVWEVIYLPEIGFMTETDKKLTALLGNVNPQLMIVPDGCDD